MRATTYRRDDQHVEPVAEWLRSELPGAGCVVGPLRWYPWSSEFYVRLAGYEFWIVVARECVQINHGDASVVLDYADPDLLESIVATLRDRVASGRADTGGGGTP